MILLGDFNIFSNGDKTLKAITDAGFQIPKVLIDRKASNIAKDKFYDQIAIWRGDRFDETERGGMLDFYDAVFSHGRRSAIRAVDRASQVRRQVRLQDVEDVPDVRPSGAVGRLQGRFRGGLSEPAGERLAERTFLSGRSRRGPRRSSDAMQVQGRDMTSLWSDDDAAAAAARYAPRGVGEDLALSTYSARLLGRDTALVMHGGGNTSVKTRAKDLFGDELDLICVKGSGWDLAVIEPPGYPAVRLQPLRRLRGSTRCRTRTWSTSSART